MYVKEFQKSISQFGVIDNLLDFTEDNNLFSSIIDLPTKKFLSISASDIIFDGLGINCINEYSLILEELIS